MTKKQLQKQIEFLQEDIEFREEIIEKLIHDWVIIRPSPKGVTSKSVVVFTEEVHTKKLVLNSTSAYFLKPVSFDGWTYGSEKRNISGPLKIKKDK